MDKQDKSKSKNTKKEKASFLDKLMKKSDQIIEEGDIRRYNYITANLMLGLISYVILIFTLLTAILNQVGVFTADKTSM